MKRILMAVGMLALLLMLQVPAMAAPALSEMGGADAEDPVRFPFQVSLSDADGNEREGEYACTVYYASGDTFDTTVRSGDIIYLGDGDYADVMDLPEGTWYSVKELDTDGWELADSSGTTGEIADGEVAEADFVNQEVPGGPEMPSAGGEGAYGILTLGSMFCAAGVFLLAVRRCHAVSA